MQPFCLLDEKSRTDESMEQRIFSLVRRSSRVEVKRVKESITLLAESWSFREHIADKLEGQVSRHGMKATVSFLSITSSKTLTRGAPYYKSGLCLVLCL